MKLLSALLLGLVVFALVSPLLVPFRPQCGMACCRSAAAHHASCGTAPTCSIAACGKTGTVADLPSLSVSTLPDQPRLEVLVVTGVFASSPEASARIFPPTLPERPPRA